MLTVENLEAKAGNRNNVKHCLLRTIQSWEEFNIFWWRCSTVKIFWWCTHGHSRILRRSKRLRNLPNYSYETKQTHESPWRNLIFFTRGCAGLQSISCVWIGVQWIIYWWNGAFMLQAILLECSSRLKTGCIADIWLFSVISNMWVFLVLCCKSTQVSWSKHFSAWKSTEHLKDSLLFHFLLVRKRINHV